MNDPRLPLTRDPFALLVSWTAPALNDPGAAGLNVAVASPSAKPKRSLLDRFEQWLWAARQRELERALANASSVVEVEARLRERERRLLQRYY